MSRAVLVDRDGTLIEDRGYAHRVEDYAPLPGAAEALARLAAAGFRIALVTNQSGIGRGYFGEDDFARFQAHLLADFRARGARIDAVYHCPHAPDAGCACRKPLPGLALRAARELGLDLAECWVVGDSAADTGLAAAVGARALLVRTGHGARADAEVEPDVPRVADLAAAAEHILGRA